MCGTEKVIVFAGVSNYTYELLDSEELDGQDELGCETWIFFASTEHLEKQEA